MGWNIPWNIFETFDLQKIVKLIGYAEIGVQIFGVIAYGIVIVNQSESFYESFNTTGFNFNTTGCTEFWKAFSKDHHNDTSCFLWSDMVEMSTGGFGVIIHFIQLLMAFKLIKGAEMRHEKKCHTWMIVSALFTTLESGIGIGKFTVEAFEDVRKGKLLLAYLIPSVLYKFCSCGVVRSYVTQVKRMKKNLLESRSSQTQTEILDSSTLIGSETDPLIV